MHEHSHLQPTSSTSSSHHLASGGTCCPWNRGCVYAMAPCCVHVGGGRARVSRLLTQNCLRAPHAHGSTVLCANSVTAQNAWLCASSLTWPGSRLLGVDLQHQTWGPWLSPYKHQGSTLTPNLARTSSIQTTHLLHLLQHPMLHASQRGRALRDAAVGLAHARGGGGGGLDGEGA